MREKEHFALSFFLDFALLLLLLLTNKAFNERLHYHCASILILVLEASSTKLRVQKVALLLASIFIPSQFLN